MIGKSRAVCQNCATLPVLDDVPPPPLRLNADAEKCLLELDGDGSRGSLSDADFYRLAASREAQQRHRIINALLRETRNVRRYILFCDDDITGMTMAAAQSPTKRGPIKPSSFWNWFL